MATAEALPEDTGRVHDVREGVLTAPRASIAGFDTIAAGLEAQDGPLIERGKAHLSIEWLAWERWSSTSRGCDRYVAVRVGRQRAAVT